MRRTSLIVGIGLLGIAPFALAADDPDVPAGMYADLNLFPGENVTTGTYSVEGALGLNGATFTPTKLTVFSLGGAAAPYGNGQVFFNAGTIAPVEIDLSGSSTLFVNTSANSSKVTLNFGTELRVNSSFNITAALGSDGVLTVDSAAVLVGAGATLTADSFVGSGFGTLRGDGNVEASAFSAGVISPGEQFYVGHLSVAAPSVDLGSSFYDLTLRDGGSGLAADLFSVSGSTSLGGTMSIDLIDGDLSTLDGSEGFLILESTSLSGTFLVDEAYGVDRITVEDINGNVGSFLVSYDYVAGTVSLGDYQPVPEPAMLGLIGLGGLALRRRRA